MKILIDEENQEKEYLEKQIRKVSAILRTLRENLFRIDEEKNNLEVFPVNTCRTALHNIRKEKITRQDMIKEFKKFKFNIFKANVLVDELEERGDIYKIGNTFRITDFRSL